MKYPVRVITAFSAFIIGVAVFSAWLDFYYIPNQILITPQQMDSMVAPSKGRVYLRFLECAENTSLYLLENQTESPIFARFRSGDYWKEWKTRNVMYGTYKAEYKKTDSDIFINVSDKQDAPPNFRTIQPNEIVCYGIRMNKGTGVYKVTVPYLNNYRMVQILENNPPSNELIKQISWKEVVSEETNITCK